MNFFAIPNHTSHAAGPCNPAASATCYPRPAFPDKEAFRAWGAHKDTQHLFYSPCEGLIPSERVGGTNPPKLLHGLVGDYDQHGITVEMREAITKNPKNTYLPTWSSETFSKGARLVWEFEEPMLCDNPELMKRFYQIAEKEVNATHILPHFDPSSFRNTQYFEIGTDWREVVGGAPIPSSVVGLWLFKAAMMKGLRLEGQEIPMEDIAEEVERRWPGVWPGKFQEGARGPLFWLEDGINRIGCQVGSKGMICYSSRASSSFIPWSEILGKKFVEKWNEDRFGAAARDLWFDGKSYWWHVDEEYIPRNKEDSIMHLKRLGISGKTEAKQNLSDAERTLCMVQDTKKVAMAAPLLFVKDEIVVMDGENVLNIGRREALEEATGEGAADPANFPWLWEWVNKAWDSAEQNGIPQRDYFLAWLKRFWESARECKLLQGQMLIVAGGAGQGKTFMSRHIVGGALGGSVDAAAFLQGRTAFNKQAAETPVWRIDDAISNATRADANRFNETLKAHIANPIASYHPKFRDSVELPWKGRIVLTCNTDPDSLSIIPSLDNTVADKIMLMKFSSWIPSFKASHEQEAMVQAELPYFLAWLKAWNPPAKVIDRGNPRYGVVSFHHPELLETSQEASSTQSFLEVLEMWRGAYLKARVGMEKEMPLELHLTAAELLNELRKERDTLANLTRDWSPRWLGQNLRKLSGRWLPLLEPKRNRVNTVVWGIDLNRG